MTERIKKTPEVEQRLNEIKIDHRAIERVLRSIADEARNKKSYKHALICDLYTWAYNLAVYAMHLKEDYIKQGKEQQQ